MSGAVSFQITGTNKLEARLKSVPPGVKSRIGHAIADEMVLLNTAALDRMTELFKNGGGKMRDALAISQTETNESVSGTLSASGLPYLAIQEYGGVTSPHDIFPVNAKALAFFGQGAAEFLPGGDATGPLVFAKGVHHPGSKMPERSFLRYALATRRSAIRAAIFGAVNDAINDSSAPSGD
jgi:hypothetical protein